MQPITGRHHVAQVRPRGPQRRLGYRSSNVNFAVSKQNKLHY